MINIKAHRTDMPGYATSLGLVSKGFHGLNTKGGDPIRWEARIGDDILISVDHIYPWLTDKDVVFHIDKFTKHRLLPQDNAQKIVQMIETHYDDYMS